MYLISIELNNWRCFEGRHVLDFSTSTSQPVTLIFGENGGGKTALLNAITWALFGEFTDFFVDDEADRPALVNKHVLNTTGLDTVASVNLKLDHLGKIYEVRREYSPTKHVINNTRLTILCDGQRKTESDLIQIMPKEVREIFFFDAETFSNARVLNASQGESMALKTINAINRLLGIESLAKAKDDLNIASNHRKLDVKGVTDDTIQKYQHRRDKLAAEVHAIEEELKVFPEKIAKAKDEHSEAKNKVERQEHSGIDALYAQSAKYKEELGHLTAMHKKAHDVATELARYAHFHFANDAVKKALRHFQAAEDQNLLPSKIDKETIATSLSSNVCKLCSMPLTTEARAQIKRMLEFSSDATVSAKAIGVRQSLMQHLDTFAYSFNDIRNQIKTFDDFNPTPIEGEEAGNIIQSILRNIISGIQSEMSHFEQQLKDVEEQIGDNQHDSMAVEKEVTARNALQALKERKAKAEEELNEKQKELKTVDKELNKRTKGSERDQQRGIARQILTEAKDFLSEYLDIIKRRSRDDFERAINEIYDNLGRTKVLLSIDDKFQITPKTEDGATKELSTGQKIVTLVSFVAALAKLAPQYQELSKSRNFDEIGSTSMSREHALPVVIDSPLSQLDPGHGTGVIELISTVLPQIVIPTNSLRIDEWQKIRDKVGAAYALEAIGSKTHKQERVITWDGKDYSLITIDNDAGRAYSQIHSMQPIERGT